MSTSDASLSARFMAIDICTRPPALAKSCTRRSTASTSTSSAQRPKLLGQLAHPALRRSMIPLSLLFVIPPSPTAPRTTASEQRPRGSRFQSRDQFPPWMDVDPCRHPAVGNGECGLGGVACLDCAVTNTTCTAAGQRE